MEFAWTRTLPPLPVLSLLVSAEMPVRKCGSAEVESIARVPATKTDTSPPLPVPNVLLEISPLPAIEISPAITVTEPALPVFPPSASAKMPVADSAVTPWSMVKPPATVTVMCPPFPGPEVLLEITPPLRMVSAPGPVPLTATETLPAFPEPAVLLEISPPLATVSAPAFTFTLPASPLLPLYERDRTPVMLLSGVTGQGVPEVLRALQGIIQSAPSPLG